MSFREPGPDLFLVFYMYVSCLSAQRDLEKDRPTYLPVFSGKINQTK